MKLKPQRLKVRLIHNGYRSATLLLRWFNLLHNQQHNSLYICASNRHVLSTFIEAESFDLKGYVMKHVKSHNNNILKCGLRKLLYASSGTRALASYRPACYHCLQSGQQHRKLYRARQKHTTNTNIGKIKRTC